VAEQTALDSLLEESEHRRDCPTYMPIGTRDSFMCICGLSAARAELASLREDLRVMSDRAALWQERNGRFIHAFGCAIKERNADGGTAHAAEIVSKLRDELATVKARLKQCRDDDAPYRAEENERLRQQERDLRDAYYEGQWSERERAAGEQGW
jgi:hypothetical protein